jgi:GNAT superfamily N-acetyltransferase
MNIDIYDASDLSRNQWRQLQYVSRQAFNSSLTGRTGEEIDSLIAWDNENIHDYYYSHYDPNTLVGRNGYYDNQEYFKPRVAVAHDQDKAYGFAYTAQNVSGESKIKRQLKKISIVKNYLWVREIAVLPSRQLEGIGKSLGRKVLEDAIPVQPVATYIWPNEIVGIQKKLEVLGFESTGEDEIDIFNTGEQIIQRRMQASSVKSVLEKLS